MCLFSLFTLTALASAMPSPSPRAASWTPTPSTLWWVVTGLYYHESRIFSTPAHQNSWGYVTFNMTNSITSTTSQCEAASDQLEDFFYGTQTYDCENLDPATVGGSSFTFNRPGKQVQVEQDWYCVEGTNSVHYDAGGSAIQQLTCQSTFWQNPNWSSPSDGLYSIETLECTPVEISVPEEWITAVA